jgi:hypothetical protein
LVERAPEKREVTGSTPVSTTIENNQVDWSLVASSIQERSSRRLQLGVGVEPTTDSLSWKVMKG